MPENQTLQRLNYIFDIIGMYFEFLVLFLIAEYPCAKQEMLEQLLPKDAFSAVLADTAAAQNHWQSLEV